MKDDLINTFNRSEDMNVIEIVTQFVHPTNGRIVSVTMDNSITGHEAIAELIAAEFIPPHIESYGLALKGGVMIDMGATFAENEIKNNSIIRVIPATAAGG